MSPVQGALFDLPGQPRQSVLDAIEPGAVVVVRAGADIAWPSAYRFTVTGQPTFTRQAGGETWVQVTGKLPRQPGMIGQRRQVRPILRTHLIEVAEPAPSPVGPRPGDRVSDDDVSLPLPGPGGWHITTRACPACGVRCVVRAQFGPGVVNPEWKCGGCGESGRVERSPR